MLYCSIFQKWNRLRKQNLYKNHCVFNRIITDKLAAINYNTIGICRYLGERSKSQSLLFHTNRFRIVSWPIATTFTMSLTSQRNPCIRDATNKAAPHRPEGRRPVWSQSLFMRDTSRIAVTDTSCVFSPKSKRCANLVMYMQGSVEDKQMCNDNPNSYGLLVWTWTVREVDSIVKF